MAKKSKKVTGKKTATVLHVAPTFKEDADAPATHESKARAAMLGALAGKFRAFHFIVEANEDLLKRPFYSLEVDEDGRHDSDSFALLKQQAEVILSCNFQPRGSKQRDDLTWADAYWSRESGLDPHLPFEVGLCVSRKPDARRQAKTLALLTCSKKIGGLGLVPDQEGNHLDIPGAGILFTRDMVLVTRNGSNLGTCSIMEALQNTHRAEWQKALPEEVEARKAAQVLIQAQRDEEAKADAAAAMFLNELAAIERTQAEKLAEQRRQRWAEQVSADLQLSASWEVVRRSLNLEWEAQREECAMVNGLVRPGQPSQEAVRKFAREVDREALEGFAAWIKDTYAARENMSLPQCVCLLRENVGGLVNEWFTESGELVPKLLGLGEYSTYEEFRQAVEEFPGNEGSGVGTLLVELEARLGSIKDA